MPVPSSPEQVAAPQLFQRELANLDSFRTQTSKSAHIKRFSTDYRLPVLGAHSARRDRKDLCLSIEMLYTFHVKLFALVLRIAAVSEAFSTVASRSPGVCQRLSLASAFKPRSPGVSCWDSHDMRQTGFFTSHRRMGLCHLGEATLWLSVLCVCALVDCAGMQRPGKHGSVPSRAF